MLLRHVSGDVAIRSPLQTTRPRTVTNQCAAQYRPKWILCTQHSDHRYERQQQMKTTRCTYKTKQNERNKAHQFTENKIYRLHTCCMRIAKRVREGGRVACHSSLAELWSGKPILPPPPAPIPLTRKPVAKTEYSDHSPAKCKQATVTNF